MSPENENENKIENTSPEVPHKRARCGVHHNDSVLVPNAAACQRNNAALGSSHGGRRHCARSLPCQVA